MKTETLILLYERDLKKLAGEVSLYKTDNELWLVKEGISNSGGNLCLHLLGNLNHFIGATLGHTGYVRNREEEFSEKAVPREELLNSITNCTAVVKETLESLTTADLEKDFPLEFQGKLLSTAHMLVHLYAHLNYHLGQINYHRRLLG